jgi:hypothetical protein
MEDAMNITTALNKRNQAKSRLVDLYSKAEIYGMTSDEINTAYNDILADLAKAPQWVRAYLDGCRSILNDQAYRNQLVYGAFIDGKFYSTDRNRDDYYEKHGLSANVFSESEKQQIGHYWARNLRPYYINHNGE